MSEKETIDLIHPQPYERIGARFILAGRIPKSWLKANWGGVDNRVFLDFLDINGQTFIGSSADIIPTLFSVFKKKLKFSTMVQFNQFNVAFIARSQGRITIRISGHKDGHSFFLPLIVNGFEPDGGVDSKINEEHKNIGKKVLQYEIDLKNYNKAFSEIRRGVVHNREILEGVFGIFEGSENKFEPFSESEEDKQVKELEKKYKDAIEWRGPLFGGRAGKMDGFVFQVYSGDHAPKHFHIIHKGRGVDARFSFPQIELIDYKGRSSIIGNKEKYKIREHFKISENFQKLDEEFQKQIS